MDLTICLHVASFLDYKNGKQKTKINNDGWIDCSIGNFNIFRYNKNSFFTAEYLHIRQFGLFKTEVRRSQFRWNGSYLYESPFFKCLLSKNSIKQSAYECM